MSEFAWKSNSTYLQLYFDTSDVSWCRHERFLNMYEIIASQQRNVKKKSFREKNENAQTFVYESDW